MSFHGNAKLGLAGRYALVCAVQEGMSLKAVAAAFSVSAATAHRWWHRWLEAGDQARESLACLFDRSSRLHRSPRQLAPEFAEAICSCRRPGDLLHMDTSEYARFQRPGHRVTGDRRSQDRQHRGGVDVVHAIVDDYSRLAYAEIHRDQRAATVAGFLERALAFYRQHGISPKRLMTDNAWTYTRSRQLHRLLDRHQIRHLTTMPYRPRTNGKVERFHQTMAREWAYGLIYPSHRERAAALPHWLDHYNHRRPHSSIGDRPPISRVHNLRGQDI